MKYSIQEFAREIRRLYPNDYDDLSDAKLVELWMKKYPNDKEKIKKEEESSWGGLFNFLFYGAVIWVGLSVFNSFHRIGFVENINSTVFHYKNKNISTDSRSPNSDSANESIESSNNSNNCLENIKITKKANDDVDFYNLTSIGLSSEKINILKKILSDPNPDSHPKPQSVCEITSKCKWCSREYANSSSFIPLQEVLKINLVFSDFTFHWCLYESTLGPKKEYFKGDLALFEEIVSDYNKGIMFVCSLDFHQKEFCSEKCRIEYKDSERR